MSVSEEVSVSVPSVSVPSVSEEVSVLSVSEV